MPVSTVGQQQQDRRCLYWEERRLVNRHAGSVVVVLVVVVVGWCHHREIPQAPLLLLRTAVLHQPGVADPVPVVE